LGMPTISLLRLGLTMGVGPSQIPSDSPLGCLLANFGPLCLTPDLKPQKLIFLCNQAWPQYPLDNASKWPLNGTFNPNILRDLYNLCECAGKWKGLSYIQSFPYLCTKHSLCIPCSPAQVLLPLNKLLSELNPLPNPLLPHVSRLLALLTNFPVMELNKPLPANSGLVVIPALGSSCSLPVG
jgi:hypothetical protein